MMLLEPFNVPTERMPGQSCIDSNLCSRAPRTTSTEEHFYSSHFHTCHRNSSQRVKSCAATDVSTHGVVACLLARLPPMRVVVSLNPVWSDCACQITQVTPTPLFLCRFSWEILMALKRSYDQSICDFTRFSIKHPEDPISLYLYDVHPSVPAQLLI